VCGDGFGDAPEVCDDGNVLPGDGCNSTCSAVDPGFVCSSIGGACVAICGNGTIQGNESCDDSNTVNGDGCDNACQVETPPTAEVEANGTFADANARALDATPILITGTSTLIAGAITPSGDKDIFKMTVAADSVVRFETFDTTGSGCAGGITTNLRLFDAAQLQIVTDSVLGYASGISACSALVYRLAAGTYYVQVEETGNNAAIAGYRLQVKVQTGKGSESEVNETSVQTDFLPGSDVFVFGNHQQNLDSDVYAVTVPAGKSLRAEVIEGSTAETCESNGVDSRLTLYGPTGTLLVDDDDDGRGYCSLIDGTGATAQDNGAKGLAAGTYYLQVRASSLTSAQTGPGGQFDYRLAVTIR
jgi:cysteine-rich repeat protein